RNTDGSRVSAETGVAALRAGVRAAGSNLALLKKLPRGGTVALTAALDAVFDALLAPDAKASWPLARNSAIRSVVGISLEKLARHGADARRLKNLRSALARLASGEVPLEEFAEHVERMLEAA
ncbi:MAG: hypothetical protein ACREID_07060, partial [Planctomycetota bacterium]